MSDHPLDHPATTLKRAELIRKKPFLKAFYEDAYAFFRRAAHPYRGLVDTKILEIGSGAGFIKEMIPEVITSEYLSIPSVDLPNCSALALPFRDGELSCVFLLDVLHHLPDLDAFFREMTRVLKPGGTLAMIEPANTFLARFIYKYFHHEAFDPGAREWRLPAGGGPLSSANSALPWIALVRDRQRFEERFPGLKLELLEPFGPLLYPLSGGVSRENQFLPGSCLPIVRAMEFLFSSFSGSLGLFYRIVIRRPPPAHRV